MIIQKQLIQINWNSNFQQHFLSLGYEKLKIGTSFIVPLQHVPLNSRVKVQCICDNCGEQFDRQYFRVSKYDKHFCKNCKVAQHKYFMKLKYGVESSNDVPEIKAKMVNTFKKHYGKENIDEHDKYIQKMQNNYFYKTGYANPSQNPEVKKKKENNYLLKTGYKHPFANPEIIKSKLQKILTTKRNTIPTSKYQKHLCNLLNGELNYIFDRVAIDIAFPEELIAIEYNGSGHYYGVLIGRETLQHAKRRDLKRCYFLKRNGWKMIIIDHFDPKKKPYSDEVMIKIIQFSKQYLLHSQRKWIRIDIDNDRLYAKNLDIVINEKGDFNNDLSIM